MLKDCLVNYLVKDNGRIPGFTESIWIMFLTLGYDFAVKLWLTWLNLVSSIVFASIHQMYALHSNIEVLPLIESSQICCRHLGCLRDGCSERILARVMQGANILETDPNTGKPTLTYASLHKAELFDSFIWEVLRMKGDTIAVFRLSTKDAPLGGYVIPKGLLSIRPMETVSLTNSYRIFDYPHRCSFP